MMGKQEKQKSLYTYNVDLDKRVRRSNPLRQVAEVVDFGFVRDKVKSCYGYKGNESVDPEVIMKMMFLLFFDNVSSERELMRIIAERLDYMWFLGYGLDETIPDHSVLSKARKRWGTKVFEELFIAIVWQCVQAGLVSGDKIYVDASLVTANASRHSVVKGPPELIDALKKAYGKEEAKLEERGPLRKSHEPVNKGMVSRTDPDAPVVSRGGLMSRPRYKNHRVVDDKHGVITAMETTPGDVEENAQLMPLVEQHESNTSGKVETVVADAQYGTVDNFRSCHERGLRSHMANLEGNRKGTGCRAGIFSPEDFAYDPATDTYQCPAGKTLSRRKHKKKRKAYEYASTKKVCKVCAIRDQCTRTKTGAPRTLKRHYKQEAIDQARKQSFSQAARRDRVKRKWFIEGSFADAANNHGFKRSRWRRLRNQRIQDYLIAAIQNIRLLLKHGSRTPEAMAMRAKALINSMSRRVLSLFWPPEQLCPAQ